MKHRTKGTAESEDEATRVTTLRQSFHLSVLICAFIESLYIARRGEVSRLSSWVSARLSPPLLDLLLKEHHHSASDSNSYLKYIHYGLLVV